MLHGCMVCGDSLIESLQQPLRGGGVPLAHIFDVRVSHRGLERLGSLTCEGTLLARSPG